MRITHEDDDEFAERPPRKRKRHAAQAKPALKQSYESNRDVQRWLREQAAAEGEPEFAPTFLASRRDRLWILSSLGQFYTQELITDVLFEIKGGKEATVYCCAAHPATGADYLAAKVYRPRMFRSLSNDAVYRESRTQRDADGRVVRDSKRRARINRHNERGRAAQVNDWIGFEFATHQALYAAGADLPRPVARAGNAVLMEYIGAHAPAPRLHDIALPPEAAQPLFARLVANIELFLRCHRIHGDLSAYNILYQPGAAVIIDFAQAVDPRYNPEIFPLLVRDIARTAAYFAPYGVACDPEALAAELWASYMGGAVG